METRGKKGKTAKQVFEEKNREDVMSIDPEDTFYKIFCKCTKNGIHQVIHYSEEILLKLGCKEYNGDVSHLLTHQIG